MAFDIKMVEVFYKTYAARVEKYVPLWHDRSRFPKKLCMRIYTP